MFKKIRNKLKSVFDKSEEVVDPENKDIEEASAIEDVMLEGVSEEEKKAIKDHKPVKNIKENKKNLEKQIEKEEELEKQTIEDMDEQKEGFLSKTFSKLKKKQFLKTILKKYGLN